MSKSEQKETKLDIKLPETGFPRTLYFNRFRVEHEVTFCFAEFGLFSASGLLDSFACVISADALAQNKAPLVEYLKRTGVPKDEPPDWKGSPVERHVEVIDIVSMAFRGGSAETAFYHYSINGATRVTQSGGTNMAATPVVLLRSTPELQRQLIASLYDQE